jgi:hypothetical protein
VGLMRKELLCDSDDFKTFCSEYGVEENMEYPKEFPCIIVYKEYCGWLDYEFVYLTDF